MGFRAPAGEPAGADRSWAARRFFPGTAHSYDLTVHLWTLGLDRLWKRRLVRKLPPDPRRLIDQACGTGILTLRLARRYPNCTIFGVDLHREYLDMAVRKAAKCRENGLHFLVGRAEAVVFKGTFDAITSSYLAKYADLDTLVRNARSMLRPGGTLVLHDFTYPETPGLRRGYGAYFRVMRALGGRWFPEWRTVFLELEDFVRRSRWVPDLVASLRKNRFRAVRVHRQPLGIAAIVSAENSSITKS